MVENEFIDKTFKAVEQTLSVAQVSVRMHVYNKKRVCSEIDTAIMLLNNIKTLINSEEQSIEC